MRAAFVHYLHRSSRIYQNEKREKVLWCAFNGMCQVGKRCFDINRQPRKNLRADLGAGAAVSLVMLQPGGTPMRLPISQQESNLIGSLATPGFFRDGGIQHIVFGRNDDYSNDLRLDAHCQPIR